MAAKPFFSRRIPIFGNYAMVVLCVIFFLLPFILRGSRQGIDTMENKVADWLPADFPETAELRWFRSHFVGDQFVVVSWEGAYENDQTFVDLVRLLKAESVDEQDREWANIHTLPPAEQAILHEEIQARKLADELALHTTGNYHTERTANNVKWLMGRRNQWYFLTQKGELYEWKGQNNVIFMLGQAIQHIFEPPIPDGRFIRKFGSPQNNEYYNDPSKLHARFFKKVTTGPEIFSQMAGPEGTMRMGKYADRDLATLNVEIEAHKRLTGLLFGPTPKPEFDWTWKSLLDVIPESHRQKLTQADEEAFAVFVEELLAERYSGDINQLLSASQDRKLEYWYRLWNRLGPEPPPRQTCIIVSLNEPVLTELSRAVGRPVLGKPRGRILELASGACGIMPENLHIGGPPVDNVAIDEEGAITLFRLVGLSALIGISLAWISFRSFRVTMMLFFVGGTSAMASLAIVFFSGATLDAILMTMPSLVYVLAMSGAVHVVNYYRDACEEDGEEAAPETAVAHGLFPCSLAAFTTAIGLISLYTSNLIPIKKFGMFSAIATIATVLLLFTYIPAALTLWPAGYKRRDPLGENPNKGMAGLIEGFWKRVCEFVIVRYKLVIASGLLVLIFFGVGLTKIETSIQLLKLFRSDAKILDDYRWMEENMGKLVPMELIVNVDGEVQQRRDLIKNGNGQAQDPLTVEKRLELQRQLTMLQRMELSNRIRQILLTIFGSEGLNVVGSAMSSDVAVNLEQASIARNVADAELVENRHKLVEQDYLREEQIDLQGNPIPQKTIRNELWRVSLRLAALSDVDYGEFVNDLKFVVEPILSAYRIRGRIVHELQDLLESESLSKGRVLVLGPKPQKGDASYLKPNAQNVSQMVDQTLLFGDTLLELLENAGFIEGGRADKRFSWLPGDFYEKAGREFPSEADFINVISQIDCVVLIADHANFDVDVISKHAKKFVDARDHLYLLNERTGKPLPGSISARERSDGGDPFATVFTSYTGIVPIVYKAQRTLLTSLIQSIGLAFVLIALVMMILLRNWRERFSATNFLNLRGGILSMLPNVFPVVVVFGAMGHLHRLGVKVDIGSMMTASVAMGVAVDDTIHFLNWFRHGLSIGKCRLDAIRLAYSKVATAMTQTTLIAGFGLSAFAFSTFMPTQRFGILMLVLLAVALVGDLIFLPALLASPLGKYFGKEKSRSPQSPAHANDNAQTEIGTEASEKSTSSANEPAARATATLESPRSNEDSHAVPTRQSHDVRPPFFKSIRPAPFDLGGKD
ncbi:MAG TPA: MMPL family transporter [Pirellulaceae bacterium]|nr:MMPL family transporter [Pirellulaceae bacterium]HMO90895.1 MMPL family transporter [Pirellulaceae bacterium]HMP68629.1 MMPL family transporter [Pirellulaceae bacterium]